MLCDRIHLSWHPVTRTRHCFRIYRIDVTNIVRFNMNVSYSMPTLKISSSVTANVRSNFPDNWLISFCTSLVSIKICETKEKKIQVAEREVIKPFKATAGVSKRSRGRKSKAESF